MGACQSKSAAAPPTKQGPKGTKAQQAPRKTATSSAANNNTTTTTAPRSNHAAAAGALDDQISTKSGASTSSSKRSSKRNNGKKSSFASSTKQQSSSSSSNKSGSATSTERKELTNSLRRQHSDNSFLKNSLKPPVRKLTVNQNGTTGMAPTTAATKGSSTSLWQVEWESFGSTQIIDPTDVPSVCEELINKTTNQLSPQEITFIQRRVRMIVRNLRSKDASTGKTNNKMLKTFLSASSTASNKNGGGGGGNGGNGEINSISDSRHIAEKQHLLDELVLRRIFNPGQCLLKSCMASSSSLKLSSSSSSGGDPQQASSSFVPADFIGSTFCLLQSLSRNWDRVAFIAADSATKYGLTMDVNKTIKPDNKEKHILPALPVSSIASDANEDGPPAGVTMWSLCYLMALALRGTREQRLHLLFYLMVPPKQLYNFLANHPAGGIPTFLLEVGNDTVLSVPSLAHYYYYGKSFLPTADASVKQKVQAATTNKVSRKVPTVASQCMLDSIATLLTAHSFGEYNNPTSTTSTTAVAKSDNGSEDETAASAATSTTTIEDSSAAAAATAAAASQSATTQQKINSQHSRQGSSGYGFGLKRRGSDTNLKRRRDSDTNLKKMSGGDSMTTTTMTERDITNGNTTSGPKSEVMDYLREVRENPIGASYKDPALENAYQRFTEKSQHVPWMKDNKELTIDEYHEWAEEALDDAALDAIFYRIFATGILPSPSAERELVLKRWMDWQNKDAFRLWSDEGGSGDGATILDYFSQSVRKVISHDEIPFNQEKDRYGNSSPKADNLFKVWGGIGGYDGRAGLGHGMLYCVDKKWWDSWEAYVGWNWDGCHVTPLSSSRKRPGDLSSERILDRKSDSVVAGTLGSYEIMKFGLQKGVHYVLVPPSVWDILYEMYGGGPPVPRMVLPLVKVYNRRERTFSTDSKQMEDEDMSVMSVEVVATDNEAPLRIPEAIQVATHPWVVHCHVCDASQPYRRGDAGSMSIRVMALPDQPLWRLFAEVIARLSMNNVKAFNVEGLGKARLWKRIDVPNNAKDVSTRYGPWTLVCKNRFAMLPDMHQTPPASKDFYNDLREDWEAYADHATLESVGMTNNDRLMIEYAVLNKTGDFVWPREAAAKAGRARHLAEEDAAFRRMLRGVDQEDKPLENPPNVAGKTIDAMDSSGRWYQVEISEIRNNEISENPDEEGEEMDMGNSNAAASAGKIRKTIEVRQVRINFSEHGGHIEWIDVDSDRLAIAGRYTIGKETTNGDTNKPAGPSDGKAKQTVAVKKGTTEPEPNGGSKLCTFPGYGACGLTNLGNTCYANSALQCISYMPLLRAYLLSNQYKPTGDLNKDNPLGTGGKLLEEFSDLLRTMWSGKYGEKSPTRFRGHLGRARSQFSGADQQDAQELLNYMLDVLHEDSNKVKKKPYVEALEDDWVKKTSLPRVGQEAWRRFLRRNRSIIADVAMGQVLNTVACPTCHFSSRNFDPFNLLSLPFPTVADVIFQVTVVRRGTSLNCPLTLNKTKKGDRRKERFERKKPIDGVFKAPSNQLITEEYAIAMSRLADIGDLRMQLQNICGISAGRLKLCKVEELVISKDMDESNPVKTYIKVTGLPDKEGPCVKVANTTNGSDKEEVGAAPPAPTKIVAFESTLAPRPIQSVKQKHAAATADEKKEEEEVESATASEDEESEVSGELAGDVALHRSPREMRELKELIDVYGDSRECRIYDSDPLPISKAISRCLWPKTEEEFKLGLRVDAIDHKRHWFPGSVVEIVDGDAVVEGTNESASGPDAVAVSMTKVRIHFDNFSSKWDETYTIDQFHKGQVRPLYSHATPRIKPTEFMVHHRYADKSPNNTGGSTNALFGQAFYLQCQNEWSTARAGAHILAQAARFLVRSSSTDVDGGNKEATASANKVKRIYEKISGTISDLIDILIDYDRRYVLAALGTDEDVPFDEQFGERETFSNPSFDASALSAALIEKVRLLLHKLPFEVRVCTADSPLGASSSSGTATAKTKDGASSASSTTTTQSTSNSDEVPFPFSLMRTIGNFMNARHAVVLHWRDPPVEKKSGSKPIHYFTTPVMYIRPELAIHKSSIDLLDSHQVNAKGGNNKGNNNNNNKNGASPGAGGSAGLHLGVCLTEFCKQQQLHLTDCWRCPRCKDYREGKQNMQVWRLPDLLIFHIKRFNCSARWREKITTKINFPLTGLDMSEWCHSDSPVMTEDTEDSHVYDLIGVMNHYGGMTGGHYVAMCKATACGTEGSEEVGYDFNGAGASFYDLEEESGVQTGWRLGRSKDKEAAVNQSKVAAANASKGVSESAEPLWLQFDDELVEPIPPRNVVSEMAYVLFYRRRRITPSNIAKYSTLH